MKSRPILFSAPMVRALLDGTKTQTRRVVKLREFGLSNTKGYDWHFRDSHALWQDQTTAQMLMRCPHGQIGDHLWVRETWAHEIHALSARLEEDGPFVYAATDSTQHRLGDKWKPSIFMPRWASRITLEITNVRVERLNDISEADALAEGVGHDTDGWIDYLMPGTQCCISPRDSYQTLWESINGTGSWNLNPWVWVIEFKRI